MAAQIEAYGMALDGHDVRDIESAVRRFIRGEVAGHNPTFCPSAAKVGATVRQCMAERLDSENRERMKRPQLPPPDIEKTPAERKRVKDLVASTIAKLSDKSLPDRRSRGVMDGHDERFRPNFSVGFERDE